MFSRSPLQADLKRKKARLYLANRDSAATPHGFRNLRSGRNVTFLTAYFPMIRATLRTIFFFAG